MISYLFAPPSCFENDFLLVLKIEIGSIFNLLCLQESGAEIGEFLTPLIFLCHSYKKWTLVSSYTKIDRFSLFQLRKF